jgi:hypothetical protein
LVQCLFLLSSLFLCVAYSCAVVDEKDHTTGAIHKDTVKEVKKKMGFISVIKRGVTRLMVRGGLVGV